MPREGANSTSVTGSTVPASSTKATLTGRPPAPEAAQVARAPRVAHCWSAARTSRSSSPAGVRW